MPRVVLLVLVVTGPFVPGCSSRGIVTQEKAVLVAHRGASDAAPENTIPAYKLAIAEGADFFEGDFWLTRDRRIVCIHDADTERVAKGQRVLSVKDSTLEQLQDIDVGMTPPESTDPSKQVSWQPGEFKGTRIPTLEAVLAMVPDGKGFYIEIKDPDVVPYLGEVLRSSGLKREQQVVIAFDPDVVRAIKAELPGVKVLWLYWWYHDTRTGTLSNTAEEILWVAREIGADGIDINACNWVNAEFVRRVRDAGLEFHVYTIDELENATRYMAFGVDSMTTNKPRALREEIDEYSKPLEGSSDSWESLTIRDDGSLIFLPYRP